MDRYKALKCAQAMQHRFLLPDKELEEAFLQNENAYALTYGETVLLVDCEDTCDLYFATNNLEELPEAFGLLKSKRFENARFTVHVTEESKTEGQIDTVLPVLLDAGCTIREENIAYRTKRPLKEFAFASEKVRPMRDREGYLVYSMAIVLLDEAKFAMSYEAFERFTRRDGCVCLVYESDGVIKGFALGKIYNGASLFVRGMGVERTYQGFGISKHLLASLFEWGLQKGATSSMLWVERKNVRAIGLYERFAYVPYGDREVVLNYIP